MNGDASISEFFGVIERALKDWNYTVDLHHHQKYIATEWKLPEKQPGKVLESLRLVNNLCVLS